MRSRQGTAALPGSSSPAGEEAITPKQTEDRRELVNNCVHIELGSSSTDSSLPGGSFILVFASGLHGQMWESRQTAAPLMIVCDGRIV